MIKGKSKLYEFWVLLKLRKKKIFAMNWSSKEKNLTKLDLERLIGFAEMKRMGKDKFKDNHVFLLIVLVLTTRKII